MARVGNIAALYLILALNQLLFLVRQRNIRKRVLTTSGTSVIAYLVERFVHHGVVALLAEVVEILAREVDPLGAARD